MKYLTTYHMDKGNILGMILGGVQVVDVWFGAMIP
jgi:hypothetical protein